MTNTEVGCASGARVQFLRLAGVEGALAASFRLVFGLKQATVDSKPGNKISDSMHNTVNTKTRVRRCMCVSVSDSKGTTTLFKGAFRGFRVSFENDKNNS